MTNFRLEDGRRARIIRSNTIAVIEPQEKEIEDNESARKLLSWTQEKSKGKDWRPVILGVGQLKEALEEFESDLSDIDSIILSVSNGDEGAGGASLCKIVANEKIVICAGRSEVI